MAEYCIHFLQPQLSPLAADEGMEVGPRTYVWARTFDGFDDISDSVVRIGDVPYFKLQTNLGDDKSPLWKSILIPCAGVISSIDEVPPVDEEESERPSAGPARVGKLLS